MQSKQQLQEQPTDLKPRLGFMIPLEQSKILLKEQNADWNILDETGEVYGRTLHGKGKIEYKNGNTYDGEFSMGMLHGKGLFTWANGVIYEGTFEYNKLEGNGKYNWIDGSWYEGEIHNGYRHGYGEFHAPNDDAVYKGYWHNGLRDGKGTLNYKNGSVYEGDFKEGYKHGEGKMVYPSKNIYTGCWEFDKKCGFGVMNWFHLNEKYEGNWAENKQNGFGMHIWIENKGEGKFLRNRYEGEWLDGLRNGCGVFYFANGARYDGEWKDNLKNGFAIFMNEEGKITRAQFEKDKMIEQEDKNKLKQLLDEQEQINQNAQLKQLKDIIENKAITEDDIKQQTNQQQQQQQQKKKESKEEIKDGKESRDGKETKDSKRQRSELAISEKSMIKEREKSTASSRKKKAQISPQDQKRNKDPEVEPNPYFNLIDISDLLRFEKDAYNIITNINTMLLRHNVKLKQWYRIYSSIKVDEQYESEFSFAMNLQKFWAFLKDCKVLGSKVTFAAIDRIYYQGAKNRYNLTNKHKPMRNNIIIQKRYFPVYQYTPEEYLFQEMLSKITDGNDTPFQLTPEFLDQTSTIYEDYFDCPQDIHNPSTIILFRQFAEILVRTAYLKYSATSNVPNNMAELHRGLEKLILKITSAMENKGKNREQSQNQSGVSQDIRSGKSEEIYAKYLSYIKNSQERLKQLFLSNIINPKTFPFEPLDETITIKTLFRQLVRAKLLNDDLEKTLLIQIIEKHFDKDESYIQVEVQVLLQTREQHNKSKLSQSKQSSQNKERERELAFYRQKMVRFQYLLESELIYTQYIEILMLYFLKKIKMEKQEAGKDRSSKAEPLDEKIRSYFEHFLLENSNLKLLEDDRIWPRTEKDEQVKLLYEQRLKREEEARQRKIKWAEKEKEKKERELMMAEDKRLPQSDEEEEESDDLSDLQDDF